jgi:O-antigen/teichoic acid export membrane protein
LKKTFIKNLGFLLILNVVVKPLFVFGIDREVQNRVGVEVYGSYFYLFNIALIFQIILDLGIENFIRKEIAQFPHLVSRYLSNIFFLKGILGIIFFIMSFGIALLLGIKTSVIPLFIIILINQFLASFILYLRANLGGLQLFKTESVISVLDRTIMIIVVGILLYRPGERTEFKIMWFVLAQTFAYAIALAINLSIVLKKTQFFRPELNFEKLLPIINKLKPYALLVLLNSIYYRVDSLLLVKLLPDGASESGIYAHGFRILDFMSNYALLFPVLLLPIFSRTLQQKEKIDGLLKLSALLLIVPSLAIIIPSIFYRYEIFSLLYGDHITKSADAYVFLTITYIGMCFSYTFGALLTANGNLRQLNIMASIAVVISLTANIILIPTYKVMGAAISNALTHLFTIFFLVIAAIRIFQLQLNIYTLLKLVGFLIVIIGVGICLNYLELFWLIKFIILASLGMIFAFSTRLISILGIIRIIKQQ